MNALLRPALLVAFSSLTVGCSLPSAETSVQGPSFSLTAEEPVAAFEVTLCLEGPKPKAVFVSASIVADARTTGEGATLRIESLADRPADEVSDALEVTAQGEELMFWLEADGPWKDGGRRCSAPETVEFSAEGLAPGESLDVESWLVSMEVEWDAGAFGDGPEDDDLSVEIERL